MSERERDREKEKREREKRRRKDMTEREIDREKEKRDREKEREKERKRGSPSTLRVTSLEMPLPMLLSALQRYCPSSFTVARCTNRLPLLWILLGREICLCS